ncbi:MAG TPA: 30S ribosomal protein S6 [Thermoleophilaceae bacterium]|nr:30S ribosomal protein S6 [Thermoleophilaceae bacterium]
MVHLYDLMLLLDAAAPEERRQEILAEVQGMIGDGGELTEVHDWGSRRLTFEIDHRPEADYKLLRFEGGNDVLDRLNSSLKIMDGVLRFRIIRQKPGGPEVPPRPEPARAGGRADEPEGRVAARAAADAAPEPADAE